VHYRSALEADWAAALDHLGIQHEYEVLDEVLPTGERYHPDFWLPELETVIEVKGEGIGGAHKPVLLAQARPEWIVLTGLAPVRNRDVNGRWSLAVNWRPCPPSRPLRLAPCGHCGRWQWAPLAAVLTCRCCGGATSRCHLAGPGEIVFRALGRSERRVA
jgi:hypothetical protein